MKNYRIIAKTLEKHFDTFRQTLVLLGARQVGKTTLLKRLFPDALYIQADEKPVADLLETYSSENYKKIIHDYKQIVIDEMHLISNPGRAVKLIYDQFQDLQIIITGSSSLHIKNKTAESMAGRAITYHLYPLTYTEYLHQLDIEQFELNSIILNKVISLDNSKTVKLYNHKNLLDDILKYGLYPDLINQNEKIAYLENLSQRAIFKDIVELNLVENRAKALELLKVLAYQIGNLISYAEISRKIGLTIPTIQRYIDIFEDSYILFRLFPYSKNKRDEIGKSPKIYFWDVGLRNSLINNFDNPAIRNDTGALFENFVITEIKKENEYSKSRYTLNYWRTKSGAEIDLVLSKHSELIGVELKYNKGKITTAFKNRYPEAKTLVINSENFY